MMDRREFIKVVCALTGYMLVPLGCSQESTSTVTDGASGAGAERAPLNTSFADVTPKQQFVDSRSRIISVTHELYGAIDLTLENVDDESSSTEVEQFSLSLSGPRSPLLEERAWPVYNEDLGYFDLFLQQGEVSGDKQYYRAVFSLLRAA